MLKIRKSTKRDIPEILNLIKELALFEKAPNEVIITEEDLLKDGFENPIFKSLVAEKEDKIIGLALYFYKYSTWKGKTIHLEDLIITETERGNGVGNSLLNEVISISKQEGVERLEWNVLDWNKPAIDFYEKKGATIEKEWLLCRMNKKDL